MKIDIEYAFTLLIVSVRCVSQVCDLTGSSVMTCEVFPVTHALSLFLSGSHMIRLHGFSFLQLKGKSISFLCTLEL